MDQPLPLSQLFLCSQFNEEEVDDRHANEDYSSAATNAPNSEKLGRKRMSFLVVHDISDSSPYAILKVPENATTRDVIKQAVLKGGKFYLVTIVILFLDLESKQISSIIYKLIIPKCFLL